jgi:hypothetical protein
VDHVVAAGDTPETYNHATSLDSSLLECNQNFSRQTDGTFVLRSSRRVSDSYPAVVHLLVPSHLVPVLRRFTSSTLFCHLSSSYVLRQQYSSVLYRRVSSLYAKTPGSIAHTTTKPYTIDVNTSRPLSGRLQPKLAKKAYHYLHHHHTLYVRFIIQRMMMIKIRISIFSPIITFTLR